MLKKMDWKPLEKSPDFGESGFREEPCPPIGFYVWKILNDKLEEVSELLRLGGGQG